MLREAGGAPWGWLGTRPSQLHRLAWLHPRAQLPDPAWIHRLARLHLPARLRCPSQQGTAFQTSRALYPKAPGFYNLPPQPVLQEQVDGSGKLKTTEN